MTVRKKDQMPHHDAAEPAEFTLISNETLQTMYARLLKCVDGRKAAAAFAGVDVAVGMDLGDEDQVFTEAPRAGEGRLHGRGHSGARAAASGRELPEALRAALGAALLQQTLHHHGVTVVLAGAASLAQRPDVLEAARAHRLPVVFVAEEMNTRTPADLAGALRRDLPAGEEMPHITVDGNDVVALYRVAHESIERARRGRGPTLIECVVFRGHRGANDPVANLERYLRGKGLLHRKR